MKAKAILTVVVAMVAVLSLLGAPSTAAPKSWPKLLLSRDGQTWTATLEDPLFPASSVWVPGDVDTQTFYIRNKTGGPARLGVVIRLNDRSRLVKSRQLQMSAKVGDAPWVALVKSRQQVVKVVMAAGAIEPVLVRVQMPASAKNRSMNKREPFHFTVRLTSLPKH